LFLIAERLFKCVVDIDVHPLKRGDTHTVGIVVGKCLKGMPLLLLHPLMRNILDCGDDRGGSGGGIK
jgi:hypothetical protein